MSWINKLKDKAMYLSVLLFSQLFMMSKSFAVFNEPGANDISRSFLNEIFGSLLDGGSDAFGASVGTFNGAILTVGGILAAYTILAGTLGTAHDGEMLGKKFSSVYIPIRYALGTALVLPVLSGGYCVMQALVMWIIMQGVALGNTVWTAYANNPPALHTALNANVKKNIQKFVDDVYLAQVCVAANKQAVADRPGILTNSLTVDYKAQFKNNTWLFGDQGLRLGNVAVCGQVSYPRKPEVKVTSSSQTVASLGGIENMFKVSDLTPIYTAHTQQIDEIVKQTQTLAEKAIKDQKAITYSDLENLTNNYVNALNSATSTVAQAQTALNNSARTEGWFLAGAWLSKIIFEQNKINSMANQTGVSKVVILNNDDGYSDEFNRYSANGYSAIVSNRPDLTFNAKKTDDKTKKEDSNQSTGLGSFAEYVSGFVTGIDLENIKSDTRHPLIVMVRVGDGILGAVIVGLIAALIPAAATGYVTGGAAATVVFTTLAGPLLAFIATGAMLTYILPNLPLMIWMGIIIGWTIMVVEAIIAAPLWAVMHLHPNGDDLTGRGGNGYMLVLGLLLRPTLVIFGLIASIVLSGLFGQLVNKIFFDVFSANMGDAGVGFFAVIFGTGIYAAIMMTVIKQTFNLMHVVPDQLMRWIGGGGEQLGQYAGGFSGEGMAKAAAAAGAVTGYMANTTASSIGKAGEIKAQMANRKATIDQTNLDQAARAESKQLGINKDEAEFDAKLGSDGLGHAINAQYDGPQKDAKGQTVKDAKGNEIMESGANSHDAIKDRLTASNTNTALGGNGAVGAEVYKSTLQSELKSGASFNGAGGAHEKAMAAGMDAKWGAGASQSINALKDSGMPMNTIMAQLDNKQSKIMSKTRDPEKTHEIMSAMFKEANSSKGGNFKEAFANASQNVNKALDLQPGGMKVETATAPIPEPGDNKAGNIDEGITDTNNGDFKT